MPSAATSTDGVFAVSGAGADIWGSDDGFNAVTESISGDATLVARVVDEQNTHMFAKAGITLGGLASDDARVILDARPDGNIEFMARLANGGTMSFIGGAGTTLPVWLRLARTDDRFSGAISSDGSSWTGGHGEPAASEDGVRRSGGHQPRYGGTEYRDV